MEAIKLSEVELSDIIEESLNEIFIFDADTLLFIYANHGARLNLGYSQEELSAMTPVDIKPEFTDDLFLKLVEPLTSKSQKLIQFTTIHQRKDGSQYSAEINLQYSKLRENNVFVAIILDITKRLETEKALFQATNIINRSPVVSFLWENKDNWPVEFVSNNAMSLFGYSEEEFLKGDITYMHVIYPEDQKRVGDEVCQFTSKITDKKFKHEPYRIITKQGKIKWVEDNTYIIRNDQGEITHFEGIILDVTERIEAIENQSKLQSQMGQSQHLESLGILAGGIAHDFNNILTAIMGNAALAERKVILKQDGIDKYLSNIVASSNRAADLCKQMLAYSGKGRIEVRAVDLSRVVEETSRLLEVSISKGVALNFHLNENLPLIEVDVAQIQQVIMNLVINASEAIDNNKGIISISTDIMLLEKSDLMETSFADDLPDGNYVYLEVSDTGCGMDTDTQLRIFDPFFSTKFTGRGLGLSAVLGIVRGHKGTIKVHSEVDIGTTFKVLLPINN